LPPLAQGASKGSSAISGITTDPQGLLKYCSSPELTRLAGETEQMLNITTITRV